MRITIFTGAVTFLRYEESLIKTKKFKSQLKTPGLMVPFLLGQQNGVHDFLKKRFKDKQSAQMANTCITRLRGLSQKYVDICDKTRMCMQNCMKFI